MVNDDRAERADDHERLADPDLVGDEADDEQADGVEGPVPVAERVRLGLAEAEDGLEVDREEADRDVVDDQEDADREGRADDVELEHLAERVLAALASTSMPLARASISARSRLLTISWSRSDGASSRSQNSAIDDDDQADDAADGVLVLPRRACRWCC